MVNDDGYVLVEISKGIYGLAQAGILAQQRLMSLLAKHDYHPISDSCPCILKHKTRNITFSLVVDDFGVKYHLKEDAEHLINALKELYIVKDNWAGSSLSMPNYVKEAILKFNIDTSKPFHSPIYDVSESSAMKREELTDEAIKKRVQRIVGVLLYYARAVDSSIHTLNAAERILQYLATHPDASVTSPRHSPDPDWVVSCSWETLGMSRQSMGLFYAPAPSSTSSFRQLPRANTQPLTRMQKMSHTSEQCSRVLVTLKTPRRSSLTTRSSSQW